MHRLKIILLLVVILLSSLAKGQVGKIPVGFKPIFNAKDLKGWHISVRLTKALPPALPLTMELLLAKRSLMVRAGFY